MEPSVRSADVLPGARVLHVDDDRDFGALVEAYFEREWPDATLVTETSASAGLERLEADAGVDCIVSDYDMPGTDGLDFLAAVREHHPDLPFVLYTGKGSEEIASRAIEAGVTGYFQKGGPDQHRRLINRVEHAVEEYRATLEAERYSTVLRALDYPLYVVDADERFEYVNEAFADLTGYDREALVGRPPALIKTDESVERANDVLRTLLSSEGPDTRQFEVTILTEDGDAVPCRDHMAPILRNGELRASVGILRDVSDERRTRGELVQQNRRLQEFVSIVSHDLRTPLQTASAAAELARETGDLDHLDRLESAHDRMERMADELLGVGDGTDPVQHPENVDLGALARDVWRTVGTDRGTLQADTGLTIEAAPDRLRRLLENLLKNATAHAGESVTLTVGSLDDDRGFYVADDGPGIAPDDRDRVFDPGYTTASEGTRYGLTVVERIAEGHGWEVTVTESRTGGARFEFAARPSPDREPAGEPLPAVTR
ncbi:MAG: ATP-binding protein [Salinirussus sp.]